MSCSETGRVSLASKVVRPHNVRFDGLSVPDIDEDAVSAGEEGDDEEETQATPSMFSCLFDNSASYNRIARLVKRQMNKMKVDGEVPSRVDFLIQMLKDHSLCSEAPDGQPHYADMIVEKYNQIIMKGRPKDNTTSAEVGVVGLNNEPDASKFNSKQRRGTGLPGLNAGPIKTVSKAPTFNAPVNSDVAPPKKFDASKRRGTAINLASGMSF